MNIKILKRTILTLIILSLSILWLRELTLRRAIKSTANFMAPFNKQSEDNWIIWDHSFGIIYNVTEEDLSEKKLSLGWRLYYEPDALRNGLNIHVNIFGEIVYVSDGYVINVIQALKSGDKELIINAYDKMDPI